jgi:SIR2-like domain
VATGTQTTKRIGEQMARGEVVLFTGAGFSVGACDSGGKPIPQVAQLTREIAQIVWPDEELDDELSLPDTYAAALRENRKALTDLIRARLTVDPATVTPSQTAWFSMPWLRAYTLNIDDLESAAARASTLPRRIEPHSGLHGRLPFSNRDALLYVHLNGTLSDVPDVTFSDPQFGHRHTQSNPLYEQLAADLISYPVVFVGTELRESLFWRYLALRDDKGDRGVKEMRPRSYLVTPALAKDRQRLLATYNIEHIETTAEEFADDILSQLGESVSQGLASIRTRQGLVGGTVTLPSVTDLASQPSPPRSEYLWGTQPTWDDIRTGRAVERAFESTLARLPASGCVVLTGTTGTGVSTTLMRLALQLAAENDVRWLGPNHEFDGRELSNYLKNHKKPLILCIDDADTFGRSLRDLVRDVVTTYTHVTMIVALRASRIDQILPEWRPNGTSMLEFTVPELEDTDIDALLGTLSRDNKLGALKSLSPAERVKELRHGCGRQLIVAMYEATHGDRFEHKLSEELSSLPAEQQLIYAITSLASSLRFPLTRDEILTASGDVSNTGLFALNRLASRAILAQKTNTYGARHRVIAELITDVLRNSGQLLAPYRGLTRTMAARYDAKRRKTRETKLLTALLAHQRIARNFAINDARVIYDDVEEFCKDDYHFWLQRGSLEVQVGSLTLARPYLLSARDGGQHDHRVHNEWAYYLLKDAWKNPRRPESEPQVAEAEEILLHRLDTCDGDDVYAWHIYGSQMLAWLRVSPIDQEIKASKLEAVKRRLEDGVRRHPSDRDLHSLLQAIQGEWLSMAIPDR